MKIYYRLCPKCGQIEFLSWITANEASHCHLCGTHLKLFSSKKEQEKFLKEAKREGEFYHPRQGGKTQLKI